MPSSLAPVKRLKPNGESPGRLEAVEIFAAGVHRGKPYTAADLDAMVENFNQFSAGPEALVHVPAVLGHEEDQEFLERSDLPAAAWAEKVWREGETLLADFADVPPEIVRLVNQKAYRTVSAEVYDEPPDGVPGRGKMLRRVAFLGGEIPQIKTLADIPRATFAAQARYTRVTHRLPVALFAEQRPMTRQDDLEFLLKHGGDKAVINTLTTEQLAHVVSVLRTCHKPHQAVEPEQDPEEKEVGEFFDKYAGKYHRFMTREKFVNAFKAGKKMHADKKPGVFLDYFLARGTKPIDSASSRTTASMTAPRPSGQALSLFSENEAAKVHRFAEQHPEAFHRATMTPARYVDVFKRALAAGLVRNADEYLHGRGGRAA